MDSLEALRTKRLKWVEANRENGFEEGIKRLLTELYPDNAHFIYELMQNAEDPRASRVRFALMNDSLEFEHNGDRLFTLKDVESITSIGASTKRDDPTSIGKFGVGFKAVFAYTNTPEIHSGKFHFRIHDLVVPENHGVPEIATVDRETRFVFPFDHPTKHAETAVEEIAKGLRALGDNTLLFLSHIRSIEYLLPDGTKGSLERVDHKEGRIEIRATHPGGQETVSHWLRFQKLVSVTDEKGETESRQISIAYRIEEESGNKKRRSDWKIVSVEPGEVSIYFPAEKETSKLRFHMHAPFASTVARDSVRDCDANNQLRDYIAELVVESLEIIRNQGMLTMSFLAVLPNREDSLSDFYEPIRQAIVKAFNDQPLTPTRSGAHASATSLYRGPARIAEVLGDEGLSLLADSTHPLWAANPPQQNQREDRFLDSLNIHNWGWSEFSEELSWRENDEDNRAPIEEWIARQKDDWVMRFYALIGEACSQSSDLDFSDDYRIVRVEIEGGHEHVTGSQAYFQPDVGDVVLSNIQLLKKSIFGKNQSQTQKDYAISFLKRIGVKPYDNKAIVKLNLERYREGINPSSQREHMADVQGFIDYWRENMSDTKIFSGVKFLYGNGLFGSDVLSEPSDLYIDNPYVSTGLTDFFENYRSMIERPKHRISDMYHELKEMVEFAKAIGVMWCLEILTYLATKIQPDYFRKIGRSSNSTIDKDYYINGLYWRNESSLSYLGLLDLKGFVNNGSYALSLLVWKRMCQARPEQLNAVYVPNQARQHEKKSKSSFIIDFLKNLEWIPDRDGLFNYPSDIDQDSLHPEFIFDNGNGWLTAIGFGESTRKRSEEYLSKNEAAKGIGFGSLEEAEAAKEIAEFFQERGMPMEEIRGIISQRRSTSQPEASVPNPERRRRGIWERKENAPAKESIIREQRIQPGAQPETVEAKAYLRAMYTNPDDQLVCQCCHAEMPFKVNDEYYFEAIKCVRDVDRHYFENRLALCPTCAAMYQHARETKDDEIRRLFSEKDTPDTDTASSVQITIRLAGRTFQLRFVGSHFFDLKEVLRTPSHDASPNNA